MGRTLALDVGTGTIVCAEKKVDNLEYYKVKDAFFKVNPSSFITGSALDFGEAMLKKAGANFVKIDGVLYILGDDAFKFATMFHKECLRPMAKGVLNPQEPESVVMVKELIRGVMGKAVDDTDLVYYCVPADPIDADFDIVYHSSTLKNILNDLGYKRVFKMNEGLAVVYSELENEQYTGIGISVGAGQSNIAYSFLGMPIFCFSIARSGDYIDTQVAKATNETCNVAQHIKESGIDLNAPKNKIESAISVYYDALMEYIVDQFRRLYASTDTKKLPNILDPLKIVVSGGSSLPKGFIEKFESHIREEFPVPVSTVKLADDPLFAVARGLYNAAKVKSEA